METVTLADGKVADFLNGRTVITVSPDTPARRAANLLVRERVSALLVVENGQLLGIFTSSDALELRAQASIGRGRSVSLLMTPNPDTISPEASTSDALRLMATGRLRHLPVVQDDEYLGIVTRQDFFTAAAAGQLRITGATATAWIRGGTDDKYPSGNRWFLFPGYRS